LSSVLLALGIVMVIGLAGFIFAWVALTPVKPVGEPKQLEMFLIRASDDIQQARQLVGSGR
jgi:hypothetical protein